MIPRRFIQNIQNQNWIIIWAVVFNVTFFAFRDAIGQEETDSSINLTNQLIGAWRIVQTTTTSGNDRSIDESPEVGLYIFTERHMSNMIVIGEDAREHFSDKPTDAERLHAYDRFIADSGTYEATGNTIIVSNIIAKVPNVMSYELRYEYKINENNLWLTFSRGWAPPEGKITYRLERIE